MTIRVLSEQTINKIAAGEVIENPASVVKELVENALDAEASKITIEIENGGFNLIRISDDGTGMNRDDLLLSIERHATSKIREADDLNEVLTMGFRGEALASIAAISKLSITTSQENLGTTLFSHGGKILRLEPAARNRGTTVEVRNLFYNVPARKKFQKSERSVQAEIQKLLVKYALAYPELSVYLFADGKEVMAAFPGSLQERANTVLGKDFLTEAYDVFHEEHSCQLKGFVGAPSQARSNRLGQYLFVNQRAVICPQISYAIYEGYGTQLQQRLHPTYIMQLTLPADWIDVNVHPQKREIRLREEKQVQDMVRRGIMKSFKQGSFSSLPENRDHEFVPEFKDKRAWNIETPLLFKGKEEFPAPVFNYEEDLPVIGLFDSYLIIHGCSQFDSEDGIALVDLNGATARILYERLVKGEKRPLQTLLIPITLEFPSHESDVLSEHLEEIREMGIDLRLFGENCFIVDALAPDIAENDLKALLDSCIEVVDEHLVEKERKKKLAITLSTFARSQKKEWTVSEGKRIVQELLKTESPFICPKGRKTVLRLNHEQIVQLFKKET